MMGGHHLCLQLQHCAKPTCSLPQSNWIRRRSGKNSWVRSRAVCSRLERAYQACGGRTGAHVSTRTCRIKGQGTQ